MFQLWQHGKKGKFSQSQLPSISSARLKPKELPLQVKYLSGLTEGFDLITEDVFLPLQLFSLAEYIQLLNHLRKTPVRKLHLPYLTFELKATDEFFIILANTLESLSLLEELVLPRGIRFQDLGFIAVLKNNKNIKRFSLDYTRCDESITLDKLQTFLNNLPPIHHVNLGSQEFLYKADREETIRFYFNWLHQEAPFTIVQIHYSVNLKVFEHYFGEFLSKTTPPKNIRKVYLDTYGHIPNPSEFYQKYIATTHCWIFKQFYGEKKVSWQPINLPLTTVNNFIMRVPTNIQRNLPETYLKLLPLDIMKILDEYYRYQDESFVFDTKVIQAVKAGAFLLQLKTVLLTDFGVQLSARSTFSSFFAVDLKLVTAALKIIDTPRDLFHWQAVFCELITLFVGKVDWTDYLASLVIDDSTKTRFQAYAKSLKETHEELNEFLDHALPPATSKCEEIMTKQMK